MNFKARDYQFECVEAIRSEFRQGRGTALVKLPTGSGKSTMAAEFIRQLLERKPDYRALILVPKVSIVQSFVKLLPPELTTVASHGYGTVDVSGQLVVATYQTVCRRKLPAFDLVVVDEQHRCTDLVPDSQYYSTVKRVLSLAPTTTRVLGMTATPYHGTQLSYGTGRFFTHLCFDRDLVWTTERGYTVRAIMRSGQALSFDTSRLHVDSTGEYSQWSVAELAADPELARKQVLDIIAHAHDRRKIGIACASIDHATLIHDILTSLGERSALVHSQDEDNDVSLGAFETDDSVRFCCFVTMISEGFDYPPLDCIVLLRPTRRPTLYVQLVGRALRPSPSTGKSTALVLDYGGVVEACGPISRPFLAQPRGSAKTAESITSDLRTIVCPHCGAFSFPSHAQDTITCHDCGKMIELSTKRKVDSSLHDSAQEGSLYHTEEKPKAEPKTVSGIVTYYRFRPLGRTEDVRRRTKELILHVQTPQGVRFFEVILRNAAFATIDYSLPYDQKAWLEGIERRIEQLLKDLSGRIISTKEMADTGGTPVQAVEVTLKPGQPASYRSHRVIKDYGEEPSKPKTASEKKQAKITIRLHTEAIERHLGGRVLRTGPMDAADKRFLRLGF
jgi:superfamily II DNA or RNA helicase